MKCQILTRVSVHYNGGTSNHYLRFGNPVFRDEVSKHKAYAYFPEGRMFCYIQWKANQYGTQFWRLLVLQAAVLGKPAFRVPGIKPGAKILLDVKGVDRVRKAHSLIDRIEDLGLDPSTVSPEFYLRSHQMFVSGLSVTPYTSVQHHAYLKTKVLTDKGAQ